MTKKTKFIAILTLFLLSQPALTAQDPVAHWMFDEGQGDIASDSAGTNHGTLVNGPQWTTGIIGSALEFDGVNDYVALQNNAVTTTEFTVAGWGYSGLFVC